MRTIMQATFLALANDFWYNTHDLLQRRLWEEVQRGERALQLFLGLPVSPRVS